MTKSVRFSDGIAPGCDLAEAEDNEKNMINKPSIDTVQKIFKTKSSRNNKKMSKNKIMNSSKFYFILPSVLLNFWIFTKILNFLFIRYYSDHPKIG